jgi:homoprotocatechuate degradation regulator HpaR
MATKNSSRRSPAPAQKSEGADPPEQALPRNLPLLLLQAREAVISHFRPILNYGGVTEQQWRIVRALYESGPLQPREICDFCQMLSPSLVGVLARMEEMGLINRERVDFDQRRVMVTLTSKGRTLVKKLTPLIQEQYRLIEEAMGSDLVADVYRLLDRLLLINDREIPQALAIYRSSCAGTNYG